MDKLENCVNVATKAYKNNAFGTAEKVYSEYIDTHLQNRNISNDNIAVAYNNRGHSKYMQVEFNDAVQDYNEALKYNPNLAAAYYNRGTIHYRLGSIDKAIYDMKEAVNLEPDNIEFQTGLQKSVELSNRNINRGCME